jgi:hypothetical protein
MDGRSGRPSDADPHPLDDAIVFRTQVAKLTGITHSAATFEVDHIDESRRGWAVAFEGLAQEVLDAHPASLRARSPPA